MRRARARAVRPACARGARAPRPARAKPAGEQPAREGAIVSLDAAKSADVRLHGRRTVPGAPKSRPCSTRRRAPNSRSVGGDDARERRSSPAPGSSAATPSRGDPRRSPPSTRQRDRVVRAPLAPRRGSSPRPAVRRRPRRGASGTRRRSGRRRSRPAARATAREAATPASGERRRRLSVGADVHVQASWSSAAYELLDGASDSRRARGRARASHRARRDASCSPRCGRWCRRARLRRRAAGRRRWRWRAGGAQAAHAPSTRRCRAAATGTGTPRSRVGPPADGRRARRERGWPSTRLFVSIGRSSSAYRRVERARWAAARTRQVDGARRTLLVVAIFFRSQVSTAHGGPSGWRARRNERLGGRAREARGGGARQRAGQRTATRRCPDASARGGGRPDACQPRRERANDAPRWSGIGVRSRRTPRLH